VRDCATITSKLRYDRWGVVWLLSTTWEVLLWVILVENRMCAGLEIGMWWGSISAFVVDVVVVVGGGL
jgi:hypothetical protein